jgi:hypothetical protein
VQINKMEASHQCLKFVKLDVSCDGLFSHALLRMLANNSAIPDSKDLFSDGSVLEQVLGYVGPGHWLFIAEVCKLWHQTYKMVAVAQLPTLTRHILGGGSKWFHCRPEMTLGQAVFASQSKLRWAHDAGLSMLSSSDLGMQKMSYLAGLCADSHTLALALELENGLQASDSVYLGAAASGCVSKMD